MELGERQMKKTRGPLIAALLGACLILMSGCVPLFIGGAAVGGYYLGKDQRSPTQIATDSSITATIKSKFIGDKYVDAFDINVDTYNGEVTLHGDVTNTIAREQAGKLAGEVEGVKSVDNKIRVLKPVKKEEG